MKVLKSFKRYNLNIVSWLFPTLFYIHSSCLAQVNIQSADVASINRFIDVPVEKSTGIPNIQIPLYTFKENGFEIPIALNYHAGGTRVDDMSGSVGLNWSLSSDFVISRTVKDKKDEYGYYANNGFSYDGYQIWMLGGENHVTNLLASHPNIDIEPDIFYFSIKGYAGRFLIDKNRDIQIVPEQDLKIDITFERNDVTFKFKITTPDGTQYFFEGFNEHGSVVGLWTTQDDVITAWRVNKIITRQNDVIQFSYYSYSYIVNYLEPLFQSVLVTRCPDPMTLSLLSQTVEGYLIKSITSRSSRVEFNYSSNSREDLSEVSEAKALVSMQVFDNVFNTKIKEFKFITSYFISDQTQFPNYSTSVKSYLGKRLRLDELRECDANGNCLPGYKFFYNKYNAAGRLPYRISTGRDHWGYYNGQDLNRYQFSTFRADPADPLVKLKCNAIDNRDGDSNFKMAFVLDEIRFSEGGTTSFKYECIGEDNKLYGGIRIKEILNNPGNDQPIITKRYEYYSPMLVDGIPVYAQYPGTSLPPIRIPIEWAECFRQGSKYALSSEPINFTGELSGNYVIHGKVIERQTGNGTIESYFDHSDLGNNYIDVNSYPYIITMPILSSGKLLREVIKDNDGRMVRETNYAYSAYSRTIVKPGDAAKVSFLQCAQEVIPYFLMSGSCYLTEKSKVTYDASGSAITERTLYEHNGIPTLADITQHNAKALHHFVTAEKTYSSDGSITTKRYKYPLSYKNDIIGWTDGNTLSAEAIGIKAMIDKWIIEAPIEEVTTITRNGIERATSGKLKLFNATSQTNGKISVNLKAMLDLEVPAPVEYSSAFHSKIANISNHFSFVFDSGFKPEASFNQYDQYSNLLEYNKTDDIKTSFIGGYSWTMPVAQAKNAGTNEIYYEGFEESSSNGVVNDGAQAHSGLKYYSGAKYSMSWAKPNERKYILNYWYKLNGRWTNRMQEYNGPVELSGGSAYDDIRVYPHDAQMTIFSYKPLVGITSFINDQQIRYYDYDGFNRLIHIRDQNKDIIKGYAYNYTNNTNPFYNIATSMTFQKANCPNQASGSMVEYIVPAGKHSSMFSQEEANLLAGDDVKANGQAYANAHGICIGGTQPYYNSELIKVFTSQCPAGSGQIGTRVEYKINAGKHSSIISQADVDQKAWNDMQTNGQAYANAHGNCSFKTGIEVETEFNFNNVTRIRLYDVGGTVLLKDLSLSDLSDPYFVDRRKYMIKVDVEGQAYSVVGLIITSGQSSKYVCQNRNSNADNEVYNFEDVDLTNSNHLVFKLSTSCPN